MKTLFRYLAVLLMAITMISACKSNTDEAAGQPAVAETPVSVDTVKQEDMTEYASLNATAVFLQKNVVKANAAGYIDAVNAHVGEYVAAGAVLFRIKTKEAQSIGNTINKLDPSFKFSGVNDIKASKGGYVNQVNHQVGDYVQDGEQLALITDKNSFVFLLNVPYELHNYVGPQKQVVIHLPDQTEIKGYVSSVFPSVDSVSQSQTYVVKAETKTVVPENLIATVQIVKRQTKNAVSVSKSAVLSDDTQSDFWLMKMTGSATAVKVPVKKGMETNGRIEIISPDIKPGDIVVASGNFGLPDTAKVKVTNK